MPLKAFHQDTQPELCRHRERIMLNSGEHIF